MDQVITERKDAWWLMSLLMFLFGFAAFAYLTWAAVVNVFYEWGPYTSPIYSAPYVPDWWKISPAFLLLWIPAGFRLTCYYGRKVYYRSVFGDPISCAVEEPYRKSYKGETKLPFLMNNLHRYFLYFAILLLALHWYDFAHSIFGHGEIYFGIGTLLLAVDTIALTLYVGSCHSLRHLVGGKKRAFSCEGCNCGGNYTAWKWVSFFNLKHNLWFWVSLFSICFADLYIRLLAMGILKFDPHFAL